MQPTDAMAAAQPSFTRYTNLAAERLGGKTLACSDDFFAGMENLLKPGRGIFIPDKYTDRGKWMDGWESRRKRVPGHDWCILRLATEGIIHGFDIDTNHFLGNHPPFASIEGCYAPDAEGLPGESVKWIEILPKSPLKPGAQNFYETSDRGVYTHLRLNIYPDGGVARLKVYGTVHRDWSRVGDQEEVDLASAVNGAVPVICNDMFFSHMENLLMPGRGINMGDGWETKRNRTPDNRDWVIIRLAHTGVVDRILVDTCHFKGNYPDSCLIEGLLLEGPEPADWTLSMPWKTILPKSKLQADAEHLLRLSESSDPVNYVRLTIFPDGGISRLRLWGRIWKD